MAALVPLYEVLNARQGINLLRYAPTPNSSFNLNYHQSKGLAFKLKSPHTVGDLGGKKHQTNSIENSLVNFEH